LLVFGGAGLVVPRRRPRPGDVDDIRRLSAPRTMSMRPAPEACMIPESPLARGRARRRPSVPGSSRRRSRSRPIPAYGARRSITRGFRHRLRRSLRRPLGCDTSCDVPRVRVTRRYLLAGTLCVHALV